jgi:hypothetical protein
VAKAVKIEIEGDSLDETFILKKTVVTTQRITYTYETDENGEPIDQRAMTGLEPEASSVMNEEFSAVGKQSKEPAIVTILETTEGTTEAGMNKMARDNQIGQPFRIDEITRPAPPNVIDPSKIL